MMSVKHLTQQVLHLPSLLLVYPHTALRVGVPHDLRKHRSAKCREFKGHDTCPQTHLFTQQIEYIGPIEHLSGVKHLQPDMKHGVNVGYDLLFGLC